MNHLKLCPGTFTYSPEDDNLRRTLPISRLLIDGKDFIKEVRYWTLDKYLSPLEPNILYDMMHHEWKTHDKVCIAGCSCGQPDCDPLYVHIEEKKYTMIWSNLTHMDEHTDVFKINPIIFDKEEYFAELAAMRAWMLENWIIE